ncbi:MAG: beta-N-acetylglucosaminidase domain-containing protein [Halieaceae bacterium]
MSEPFLNGIIEGFYGREWDWSARLAYADYLLDSGLNSYIYCPKSDPWLRKRWQQPWPSEMQSQLEALQQSYAERGLNWGVGLSPYALYTDYSAAARRHLQAKISGLNQLGGSLLAILFDDMPGDCPDLAARQAEILADVCAWSQASTVLACPTYYSHDPVLETHFGAMPQGYWESLGSLLPREVGVFWTGNRVCSETVSCGDLELITELMGRKPVLWDNYPVNDGAKASQFLHLEPLPGREEGLAGALSGHFCNPMNQAWLSRYPLSGLARLYGGRASTWEDCFGAELAAQLRRDQAGFEQLGLTGLDAGERQELLLCYRQFDHPAAAEVCDWLEGKYAFDPACLTG